MKWITREKVKVDRVACPSLVCTSASIRRWYPDRAGTTKAAAVVRPKGAPRANRPSGTHVSFDSILKKYGLTDPALLLMADIVRAADSRPADPHPAGEGLRWIAHGFSAPGLNRTGIYRLRRSL